MKETRSELASYEESAHRGLDLCLAALLPALSSLDLLLHFILYYLRASISQTIDVLSVTQLRDIITCAHCMTY